METPDTRSAAKRQEPMQQMDADGNVVWEDYPPDELPTIAELVGCWCRAYDADSNESGWRPCPPSLCEMEDHDHA